MSWKGKEPWHPANGEKSRIASQPASQQARRKGSHGWLSDKLFVHTGREGHLINTEMTTPSGQCYHLSLITPSQKNNEEAKVLAAAISKHHVYPMLRDARLTGELTPPNGAQPTAFLQHWHGFTEGGETKQTTALVIHPPFPKEASVCWPALKDFGRGALPKGLW